MCMYIFLYIYMIIIIIIIKKILLPLLPAHSSWARCGSGRAKPKLL